MSELPGDMVEEILCRVPAKSLKRLRSTCKRWNHLFNDRRFALKHLDKAVRESMFLMLTKELKVCSINVNLHGVSSIDVTGKLSQTDVYEVLHCDGLLLCIIRDGTRSIIVWNPCTGQTKLIQLPRSYEIGYNIFALGYEDTKSGNNNGYKILCYHGDYIDPKEEVAIYEIRSNSWRILDVNLDFKFKCLDHRVSLKGKTYWYALDGEKKHLGIFLVWFDYTKERFRRMPFPCHHPIKSGTMVLSVVREEKLALLLQCTNTSRTEVWVTNKVDETKVVSWSMVLAMDHPDFFISLHSSFLVDEEKKFVVCCDHNLMRKDGKVHHEHMVHIIEEDNKVTKVDFAASTSSTMGLRAPLLFNYVPSLVQIG